MEFDAIVFGERYTFSPLTSDSYLITSTDEQYILYKKKIWHCADEITPDLLEELGAVIEDHWQPVHR